MIELLKIEKKDIPQIPIYWTRKKALLGMFMGLITAVIYFRFYQSLEGLRYALAFTLLGLFRIDLRRTAPGEKGERLNAALRLLCSLILLLLCSHGRLNIIISDITENLSTGRVLLNLLCVFVLYGICMTLTGSNVLSFALSMLVILTLSTINGFMMVYRGKELSFMEIFAARTAANVIHNYSLMLWIRACGCWVGAALAVFFHFSLPRTQRKHPLYRRAGWLVVTLLALLGLKMGSADITLQNWQMNGSKFNGFYLNFYMGLRDSLQVKPGDYSVEAVEKIAAKYVDEAVVEEIDSLPNILVIMNEAFSDLSVFPNMPGLTQEVTPFVSSMQENTVKGHALVSVFGGGTANSEYEFLTGHSLGFLPNAYGTVPYQQYIKHEIYALPRLMTELGYDSRATHPYLSTGWSRDTVYPLMGFPQASFMEAYPRQDKIGEWISDREMYDYLLEQLKDPQRSAPLFLFGVSMQNHGEYTPRNNYPLEKIRLQGMEGQFPQTELRLSLIHESDKAVEMLLTEPEQYPEDTVVVFFGDHMPGVENEMYLAINGGELNTLDQKSLKHMVPFFIWANYDIEEYTLERTSLNYLAGHLLDAAGIPLPPYYRFLRDAEEVVPAVHSLGYYSKSADCMLPISEAVGEERETLRRLSYLQYNNILDSKKQNMLFFGQYIKQEEPILD